MPNTNKCNNKYVYQYLLMSSIYYIYIYFSLTLTNISSFFSIIYSISSKCSTDDSVVKDSVATNVSVNSSPVTSVHSHRKSNHSPPSVSNNVTPANSKLH